MTGTTFRKHRVGIIAIAAMLLAGATTFAVAQQRTAAADARLQELADEAALAGVSALAATEGQTDAKRIEAANAAVRKALASRSEIVPIIGRVAGTDGRRRHEEAHARLILPSIKHRGPMQTHRLIACAR